VPELDEDPIVFSFSFEGLDGDFVFFLGTWLHFMFLDHGSSHTIYQTGSKLGSARLIRATKHVQKIKLVWGQPSWAQLVSHGIVQPGYQTRPKWLPSLAERQ
jgi:hypothetical protein